MFRVPSLLLATIVCLVHAPALAKTVAHPLTAVPELRGRHPSATFSFRTPRADALTTPIQLKLAWTASEVLDAHNSTITVELDGRSIATKRIQQRGALQSTLGPLSEGYHTLKFIGYLQVENDPCLERNGRGAWLSVTPDSVVTWAEREVELTDPSLADLIANWHAAGKVELVPTGTCAPHTVESWLRADEYLASLGIEQGTNSGGTSLWLASVESGVPRAWAGLLDTLETSPFSASVLSYSARSLKVLGRSEQDVSSAVDGLRWGLAASLCRGSPCILPPLTPGPPSETTPPPGDELAFTLKDRGFRDGWTARGYGEHGLRFQWQRPLWWKVDRAPELSIPLTSPANPQALGRSTLSVLVNDIPLTSYRLDEALTGSSYVRIKLPKHLWSAENFDVRIDVVLRPEGEVPCLESLSELAWIHIGPELTLQVEREELVGTGIGAFSERFTQRRPGLTGRPIAWDWSVWRAVAPLLRPFSRAVTSEPWRVETSDEAEPDTIVVTTVPTAHIDTAPLPGGDGWLDLYGRFALPLTPAYDTAALQVLSTPDTASHLEIAVSPHSETFAIPVPDYLNLRTAVALWSNGQWLTLEAGSDTAKRIVRAPEAEGPQKEQAAALKSKQEQKLQVVNITWAVALGILILGSIYWLNRGVNRRAKAPVDLEHSKDPKGKH